MGWISAKDRLPEKISEDKSKEVLAYITSPKFGKVIQVLQYHYRYGYWDTMTFNCQVTHWMELPEPPKE